MKRKPTHCAKCLADPCPTVRSVKRLLGAWARERRRQGAGLFGDLPDPQAMDDVAKQAVDGMGDYECNCACHEAIAQ